MTKKNSTQASTDSANLHDNIVESIFDIKGEKVVKIDLSKLEDAPSQYFIICEATNLTQVRSIAHHIRQNAKEELGIIPSRLEGTINGNWMVVDYFDTVVHVFYKETRDLYKLEELWGDGEHVEINEEAFLKS